MCSCLYALFCQVCNTQESVIRKHWHLQVSSVRLDGVQEVSDGRMKPLQGSCHIQILTISVGFRLQVCWRYPAKHLNAAPQVRCRCMAAAVTQWINKVGVSNNFCHIPRPHTTRLWETAYIQTPCQGAHRRMHLDPHTSIACGACACWQSPIHHQPSAVA